MYLLKEAAPIPAAAGYIRRKEDFGASMELLMDSLLDAGMDTLKLIPFLFVTYLVMEVIERRAQSASGRLIQHRNTGTLGPVFGALLGAVPQCGFSAAAASLYSGGLISIGTLLAVFLSTSDEMLPLLISAQVPLSSMLRILAAKAVIGLISGLAADLVLRRLRGHGRMRPARRSLPAQGSGSAGSNGRGAGSAGNGYADSAGRGAGRVVRAGSGSSEHAAHVHTHREISMEDMPVQLSAKHIHDLCEDEHCGCEEEDGGAGAILRAAFVHTLHIVIFVLIITFVLNVAVEGFGEDAVSALLGGRPVIGIFLSAAVGLIPNCASSILITQLYLDGLIAAGQMMAGLLVGAGVGLLVLFRTNQRHPRESIAIAGLLYALGVAWGFLITAFGFTF